MNTPEVLGLINRKARHLSLRLTDLETLGLYYCCSLLNLVAWSCEKEHADLGSGKQCGLALAWIYCFRPMLFCYKLGIPGTNFLKALPSMSPSFILSHFRSLLDSLAPEIERSKEGRMR